MTLWNVNTIIIAWKMSKAEKSTYKKINCLIFDKWLGNILSTVVSLL